MKKKGVPILNKSTPPLSQVALKTGNIPTSSGGAKKAAPKKKKLF